MIHNLRISVAFTALLGFALAGCTDLSDYDLERVSDAISDSLLSVTETRNLQMDLIEDGLRIVSVTSPFAMTFSREGRSETELKDSVHVAVMDSTGAVETSVISRSARYLSKSSEFHFMDDVLVQTRDGRTLRTDYLEWSQRYRTIYSPDFVIIVTRDDSITGYGLEGTDDLVNYQLTRVTGEFKLDQGDQ